MFPLVATLSLLGSFCWIAAGLWLELPLLASWHKAPSPALALSQWLQEWQLGHGQGKALALNQDIPQFKFFGRLASQALTHARTFGSFPRELLWEWREGINKESQFDQKWNGLKFGGWAQFGLFTFITWVFIMLSADVLHTPMPQALFILVVILQGSGTLLYWPLVQALAQRRLRGTGELLECLYTLRSLASVGLPGQQVLQLARVSESVSISNSHLSSIQLRVKEMARSYQQQGVPLVKETQLLIQECWFVREDQLARLMKLTDHLRLGFLICFFGGAYFIFLIGLIQRLLAEGS